MYVHVQKYNIHVPKTSRKPQVIWQEHESIRKDIIHFPVSFPEFAIRRVARILVWSCAMQMFKVVTIERSGQDDTT